MPGLLLLDSEALSSLAYADERGVARERATFVLARAHRLRSTAMIPAAVLAEVYRGSAKDAAVDRVIIRGMRVAPLDRRIARIAGGLLARDRLDSCHAVDASIVATAVRLGGGVILTGDPDDLRSLARDHPNVVVEGLV